MQNEGGLPMIAARRNSLCAFCGLPIHVGDFIVLFEGEWGHDECPEDWEPDPLDDLPCGRGPIDAEEMREWGLKP